MENNIPSSKKMGRPPRVQQLVDVQTYVPEDFREKLNLLAGEKNTTRSEMLLEEWKEFWENPEFGNTIRIRRTHPRTENGWRLLQVKILPEDVEKITELSKLRDVSKAALIYSILIWMVYGNDYLEQ